MTEELDQIGVVTGLAYTQFGGDTLSVEATHYKGEGRLVLTGKLGDVMKESAQAALSYVKTNAEKFDINPDVLNKVIYIFMYQKGQFLKMVHLQVLQLLQQLFQPLMVKKLIIV